MLLEELKDKLVTCGPDEFIKLQGQAVAYRKLAGLITRAELNPTERT